MLRRALLAALLSCCLASVAACGADDGVGAPPDAGDAISPPADAAAPDATGEHDGGEAPDAAPPADTASPDAAAPDATDGPDGGAPADAVGDAGAPALPDPSFVYEPRTAAVVWEDAPVPEDTPTFYRTDDALPARDVRAILDTGALVLVGTASGLFAWDAVDDRFVARPIGVQSAEVVSLRAADDGTIVVGAAGGVALLRGDDAPVWLPVDDGRVAAAAPADAAIWVATDAGLGRFTPDGGGAWAWELTRADLVARDVVIAGPDETVWLATAAGLVALEDGGDRTLTAADGDLPDDDVRALAATEAGGVLAATAAGLAHIVDDAATLVLPGRGPGQLPTDDAVAVAARGGVWAIGHGIGATVRGADGERSDHYVSGRWLLADRVQAVALGPDGRRWLGTAAGLTRVDLVPRTLAGKAATMEAALDAHFWRMDGFVSSDAWFDDAWEPAEVTLRDKDNDGLWTQMQVGAWALAYGATGDPIYCEKARRAIRTMFLQIDIPAVDFEAVGLGRGFVTRSLVRDDEGAIFEDKESRPNWHRVAWTDGHDYYWKDDTSSDETTGHFFGYPLYYDLCADEAEKAEVADRAGALAGYILAHDFRLIDLDGEQTGHGEWYPELLAIALDGIPACMQAGHPADRCVGAASGHGWLNGIEILGHMLAAWHMTGEARFYEAYERLLEEHRYGELVDFHEGILTVTSPAVANHSDHELAILAYYTLIRYEPDDERRARWIRSALQVFEYERAERNALWAFLIASIATDDEADVAAAARTLHEIPLDLRKWRVDNGHRQDAKRIAADRFGDPQFDRVFPYDEIRTVWWNGNLYAVADGGDPREAQCPMFYLLPYWGLRYAGAIGP